MDDGHLDEVTLTLSLETSGENQLDGFIFILQSFLLL